MAKVTLHATIFGEDGIKTRDYETALIPDAKNQEMQVINLYPDKTYQKIEGFGAALTESAGYALSRMSEENRKNIDEIQELYLKGLTFHYVKDVKEVFSLNESRKKTDKLRLISM